jgi:hypothetical protein
MTRATRGILAVAAILVGGCGGGGGDSTPVPPAGNNLTAKSIQVLSAAPIVGYPLDVSVSIASTRAQDEVTVSLYAIGKDVPEVERRQIPLGSRTISRVEAGEQTYRLAFDVPANINAPLDYYLGMIVNAGGTVEDENPDDNTAATVARLSPPPSPNIFIKEASLDGNVIPLDTRTYEEQVAAENGVHNADAGVTIYVGAQGAAASVVLESYARLRLRRTDRTAAASLHEVPLYLWDSEAGRYTNAFAVNPPTSAPEWLSLGAFVPQLVEQVAQGAEFDVTSNELDRKSAHLDLYFPGRLARELEIAVRHLDVGVIGPALPPPDLSAADIDALRQFLSGLPASPDPAKPHDEAAAMAVLKPEICAQIRPVGFQDRDAGDNEVCTPVTLVLPALPTPPPFDYPAPPPPDYKKTANPILFSKAYNNRWGGRNFSVGVAFDGSATADNRGLIAGLSGAVPVVAFGETLEFVKASTRAQVLPNYRGAPSNQTPGVRMDLRVLGAVIASRDTSSGLVEKGVLGNVSKKYEKTKSFTVGPVPVTVTGFVMGSAGIRYELGVTGTTLGMMGEPFALLEAGASGGIGLKGFSAGVTGDVDLLQEQFTVQTGAGLSVVDDGFTSGKAQLILTPTLRVANVVTGPTGSVALYAEYSYPVLKKCSWGLFTGVCPGIKTARERLTIDSFRTFRMSDTLINAQGRIAVVSFNGQVGYYSP